MRYNDLIIEARRNGVWNDAAMEKTVKSVDGLLQYVKDVNKEVYWAFMRQQSGILYGYHYNEAFATYDVGQMCGTDKDGNTRRITFTLRTKIAMTHRQRYGGIWLVWTSRKPLRTAGQCR